jgi:ABC-type transporter Mla MlaB component
MPDLEVAVPVEDGSADSCAAGPGFPAEPACFWIYPPVGQQDVPRLCELLDALLRESDTAVVICDVSAVTSPGLGTVEALARLGLTARRQGRVLQLRGPGSELRRLLWLTGLSDTLPPCSA